MLHAHPYGTTLLDYPAAAGTAGLVTDMGWRYDLMMRLTDMLVFRGGLRRMQDQALDGAELREGDAALDVGCGTGELAMRARMRVGPTGLVVAVDPGPRQIARARAKAADRGLSVDFGTGVIERLDFPAERFDVVLSTLMMHHVPDDAKRDGVAEIARVLRPGGRVVIADFNRPPPRRGQARRFAAGLLGAQDYPSLLQEAGFEEVEARPVPLPRVPGVHGASCIVARRPAG